MADRRAKYEVQQMLRYLADGTPISPRTSPRSPDLSHSDDLLREKYDELNQLMLSHITQRKTLGHLYSSYDLDFKKVNHEGLKPAKGTEKETRTLKGSAKRLTEILDRDRGVRVKVWEMPSDSEDALGDESGDDEDEEDVIFCDDASEQTCNSTVNSTVIIQEVNTDGEDVESDYEKSNTSSKTKRVSFEEKKKEVNGDPIPSYDPNSLEALILKDILRHQRKTSTHTDSGVSFQTKGRKHRSRKRSPRQKKHLKEDPPERSPRQATKCVLDNHLDSSSNPDVKQWIREKNKIARRKLKEERKKTRIEMEKEHMELNEKAAKLLESNEKVKHWVRDKQKQALSQRKLKQRVEELQRRNASIRNTEESSQQRNNQLKEQFEIRKTAIKRRQRRIKQRNEEKEDEIIQKSDGSENVFLLEPASARLIQDEKLQAKAAKKKYGVSVRGTLNKAARQMNRDDDKIQVNLETKDLNNSKVKTPNGSRNRTNNANKKLHVRKEKNELASCRKSECNDSVTNDTERNKHVRKTNRTTYNAWIKIKREGDNSKKTAEEKSNKEVDPDLKRLLPTLSQERIRRATESKRFTDTGSQNTHSTTTTRPSSGKSRYQGNKEDSSNVAPRRPSSARNGRTQRPVSAHAAKSGSSHRPWRHDELNIVLEGERPEPQGCELPDDSYCQGSNQPGSTTNASGQRTDDVVINKKRSTDSEIDPGLEVLNTDSVFITA